MSALPSASAPSLPGTWQRQLQAALGRPIAVHLDPPATGTPDLALFTGLLLPACVDAIIHVANDGNTFTPLLATCTCLQVHASPATAPCTVRAEESTLAIQIPLQPASRNALAYRLIDAFRALMGLAPNFSLGTPRPFEGDPYAATAAFCAEAEALLRNTQLWPGDLPPDGFEPADRTPFLHTFAWHILPRLNDLVANRGPFPRTSDLASHAAASLGRSERTHAVLTLFAGFDDMLNFLRR